MNADEQNIFAFVTHDFHILKISVDMRRGEPVSGGGAPSATDPNVVGTKIRPRA